MGGAAAAPVLHHVFGVRAKFALAGDLGAIQPGKYVPRHERDVRGRRHKAVFVRGGGDALVGHRAGRLVAQVGDGAVGAGAGKDVLGVVRLPRGGRKRDSCGRRGNGLSDYLQKDREGTAGRKL